MIRNILEYLEHSAEKYPDKTAFADENTSCTYQELMTRAKHIGTALTRWIPRGMPVPVFMEKSVDTISVFMGAVYAGCFYTLLDVKQPGARIRQILDTLDCAWLVTSREYEEELEKLAFDGQVFWLEDLEKEETDAALLEEIRRNSLDTDPLYGIFTSGSTGIPKGVVVCHRSLIDFMECFTGIFGITSQDVIGNQAPWDFDVSVKDIYSGIKTGATIQIIPRRFFSIPMQLLDFLCERKVTTLIWAVSALCIVSTLKGFEYRVPAHINKILFSGEKMPVKHLNIWKKYLPDAVYVNLYGPTEITCNCSYYIIDREFQPGDILPIGYPFPNEKVFLLDEEDREIKEPGVLGEICVAGTALALGYYNNPEQTSRAFVQNPLNSRFEERIYRTGDLGYYGVDKELYFTSRKDFQIKHMGHRIELGEIEIAMERLEEIIRACCLFDEKKNKIIAFYEGSAEKRELKKKLGESLPVFMLPNVFKSIEHFPLTKNGKIDRQELKKSYLEEKT